MSMMLMFLNGCLDRLPDLKALQHVYENEVIVLISRIESDTAPP